MFETGSVGLAEIQLFFFLRLSSNNIVFDWWVVVDFDLINIVTL